MRLDKFLSHAGYGSRSDVKKMIKQGIVTVDDALCMDPGFDVQSAVVRVRGEWVHYEATVYLMMHKPAGLLSASSDSRAKTVFDLFDASSMRGLQLVGRLDKDATGLLLLTNDGDLTHQIISPKSSIEKHYIVTTNKALTRDEIARLEQGIIIDHKPTLPATINELKPCVYEFILQEGRFHQIKRMVEYVKATVTSLHRIQIGPLVLDSNLQPGQLRPLTKEEVEALKNATQGSVE
jgi:16S rRNA pseudouridine516 synthase